MEEHCRVEYIALLDESGALLDGTPFAVVKQLEELLRRDAVWSKGGVVHIELIIVEEDRLAEGGMEGRVSSSSSSRGSQGTRKGLNPSGTHLAIVHEIKRSHAEQAADGDADGVGGAFDEPGLPQLQLLV